MTMLRLACGIELDDKFVVTGGKYSNTKVAQYTEAGAVTYLPSLKTARYDHACSKFVKDNGETVSSSYYLVLNTYLCTSTIHIASGSFNQPATSSSPSHLCLFYFDTCRYRHYWLLEAIREMPIFPPRRSMLTLSGHPLHLYPRVDPRF